MEFTPPLEGDRVEYEVTVDTDFGDALRKFDVPFTCRATTGVDEGQSNACLGDDHVAYADIESDEVHPPMIFFRTSREEGSPEHFEGITSIGWGNFASDQALVTVTRDGVEVFSAEVEFEDAVCTTASGNLTYRRAIISLEE